MNRRTIMLALLVPTLALSACGGGDKKSGTGIDTPEAKAVETSARTVITDARRSCDLLTAAALKTFTGGVAGPKALAKCQQQVASGKLPPTANIIVMKLQEDRASIAYSTEDVTGAMNLLKINGKWLMDRVTTLPTR